MKDNRFQFGDIIATRSNSFLSRAIRWFMKKYRPSVESFSHIAVVIDIWGEQWIAEALAKGVRVWSLPRSGYSVKKQVVLLRLNAGFTEEQIETVSKKMISLAGVRYQYENLPLWAVKILLKINLFRKESQKAIYCSELGAIAINEAYPGTFKAPNITSPADHYGNVIYQRLDINNIL
jgi:hypothetical protein